MMCIASSVPWPTWLGLSLPDWAVLSAYLVGITLLGTWSYRHVKGMDDYFMGGRRFGKVFMVFFAFGSGTSSDQAVTVVAGSFRAGLAGIWYQFLWLWATPFYWILAPLFRRMRAFTTSDFFEHRFSTPAATLYSVYGIMISIVFMAGALFGSGKMVEGLTGGELPYGWAVAVMTVMFVVYGMAGGLTAAIITDFVQGILTLVFSVLLLPFLYAKIGGLAGLHAANETVATYRPGMLDMVLSEDVALAMGRPPITAFYVVMLSLTALAGIVVQPHIMGVCGAGKTELEGRVGFTFGNFLKRFCTIAWTFIGLGCIVLYLTPERAAEFAANPDAEKAFADQLFGFAAHEILPEIGPGLVGLLLASMLAAVMSTCDAQMVVSSGLFTENVYRRFLAPGRSQRHYVQVGRIAGVVIVSLALLLQLMFDNIIHALEIIIKTPAAMGISFWLGIMWRRYTPAAVFTSTLTAFATWLWLELSPSGAQVMGGMFPFMVMAAEEGMKMKEAWLMLSYVSVGVAVGIVTSFVTPATPAEKLDRFYRLLRTPARKGEKVEQPCELPPDAPPPHQGKLINHPSLEIPKPTTVGIVGFLGAWVMVGLIILLTVWLSRLGTPRS